MPVTPSGYNATMNSRNPFGEPEQLDAGRWRELNRTWFRGVENGLHRTFARPLCRIVPVIWLDIAITNRSILLGLTAIQAYHIDKIGKTDE